ncbi:uncharacterized protein LOC119289894 [Triticum dicoccoides]|uniref:uncharacterized protein LOC119289894 n=1 Tax=Triticum dicoccoides TaxID=85692 RepID=UPI000E7B00F5|nr:uncharacterized protein LOC119289894 [Triticum dicoccoides]
MCNKCKDFRHLTRECKIPDCIICGNNSHITEDCNWLKQIKPLPKFVGYAVRGLGVLLIQNSKEVVNSEQINPMEIITIAFREINETQFLEGLNYMFKWDWQWRCKKHGDMDYLMRFPNKSRLIELHKFGNFNLLGTKAVINVDSWTYDTQAIGKLHTMWVKLWKVHECFRHFFGACEVAATIGAVLEIDMTTILQEKIRAKVGVRDSEKIPKHTQVTDKDLMIYIMTLELERVIEQGWYEDKRKHEDIETDKDTDSDETRKKIKIGGVDAEGSKENISLGCVGLKQFEEMKKKNDEILNIEKEYLAEVGMRKKVEAGLGKVLQKLQEMEENKCRQEAWRVVEEKRHNS